MVYPNTEKLLKKGQHLAIEVTLGKEAFQLSLCTSWSNFQEAVPGLTQFTLV